MVHMTASPQEIVQTYRQLYRAGLRAVQYSTPARFTLRDRLRRAFRASPVSDFDRRRIDNTLQFLEGATKSWGQEHRILKNLLMVWYHEPHQWKMRTTKPGDMEFMSRAYDQFYHTLHMLNETMGMCIR